MEQTDSPLIIVRSQLRAAKRLLLTFTSAAILFALADVQSIFSPSVFGNTVKLQAWMLNLALIFYCSYLYVGFRHEYNRHFRLHSEALKGSAVEEIDVALRKVAKSFQGIADKAAAVAEPIEAQLTEYNVAKQAFVDPIFPITPPADDSQIRKLISAQWQEPAQAATNMNEFRKVFISSGVTEKLHKLLLDTENDVRGQLKSSYAPLVQRLDVAVEKILKSVRYISEHKQSIEESFESVAKKFKELSDDYSRNDRFMLILYDGWVPKTMFLAAIVANVLDLIDHASPWPFIRCVS